MESNHEELERRKKSKCLDKISCFIYLSHFLSSFGDRVWQFAVGLYLYYIYPCSLLLTAVYGLSTCAALFLLGAPVGRWVDQSKRLNAARISIVVQNLAVVLCAGVMTSAIYFKVEIGTLWNGHLEYLLYAVIIILEVIGELASMANKIVLEKDWIVVLARGDEQKLSTLNAVMRSINLSCNIIAPFVVGNLLEWFSYLAGAIFIASWNAVSATAEYYLLHLIFALVPELSERTKDNQELPVCPDDQLHQTDGGSTRQTPPSKTQVKLEDSSGVDPTVDITNFNQNGDTWQDGEGNLPVIVAVMEVERPQPHIQQRDNPNEEKDSKMTNNVENPPPPIKNRFRLYSFFDGWRMYFSHPVKFAGLGLASLYMTVLSFDYVTIAYLSSQGISAGLSGNMTGISSLIGILGSLSFPFFRKRLGKNIAGLLGFGMETLCLLFCVAYILAPGSQFDPASIKMVVEEGPSSCKNNTGTGAPSLSIGKQWEQHPTIFLLLFGMVTARYGLWIADLSVTQIFQENVKESQRGTLGGVQGSLNQLMSLVKFCLTIVLPYPETFGYLICLSWLFVFFGWLLFTIYVFENRRAMNKVRPQDN